MKESKAVFVTRHKITDDQRIVQQQYKDNFGCQYNKRDNVICTCRRKSSRRSSERSEDMRYFGGVPKQIYAYHGQHGSRSFTDIGVGSVKALPRRKVKRVYLPETDDRGVGSSDLSSYVLSRKNKQNENQNDGYYDHKRTSSKCVGGIIEYNTQRVISEKLSPIVQTVSGTTSPSDFMDQINIEIGSNTVDNNLITTGTQFEIEINESKDYEKHNKLDESFLVKSDVPKKLVVKVSEQTQNYKYSTDIQGKKRSVIKKKAKEVDRVYSSDSLVQHIHNLENPSDEKQSRTSIDPMENKLEREYRKMFTTKDKDSKASVDKPIPEFKSASTLRRRFEALRKGLAKREDGKKACGPSSQDSVPSRKDASVTSDPPSLEGRSYSNTKKYSPIQANIEQDKTKIQYRTEKDSAQWPKSDMDSECQGVKGMFKLWGKKFNFEEEEAKIRATPMPSIVIDIPKKDPKETKVKKVESKKGGRKFFFFKKKSKDKPPEKEIKPYKPSGVTAGRCEIRDGLTLKVGGITTPKEQISKISEEGDEIQRRTWLKKFLANTIESARSVNVRWNNSMYATSSSTVFELMDTIYKNNGVVLKSQSEITTDESSFYRSYNKNKVNFDQNIEAWMMPRTIPDRLREIPVRIQSNREMKERNIAVTISDQRWFIEKSRAFANKIEVVLQSKNLNKISNKVSSEYLRINIPKDFFDASSSDDSKQHPTSDEEVYKIVDYESVLNTKRTLDKGDHDHVSKDIEVIVSMHDSKNLEAKILETVIKRPPIQRDVVIQGSNVNIPKRRDVIGVGIITHTQRDLRDIQKPILKIQDDLSDDDSEEGIQTVHKKCNFAESYLQEYYRHWTPLGIDLFSWCVSDSHLRSCSEKSVISLHHQGDGSKSCPTIYDDFQASIISSCASSCCSQQYCEEITPPPDTFSRKVIKKIFEMTTKTKTDTDLSGKRILPKDSLEVFKRRKIYAASNKSQWACSEDKPVSVPSIESKGAQNTLVECPNINKPICKTQRATFKKPCKKHVSMPDCDTMNEILADQLADKKPEGILVIKGQAGCDTCKQQGFKCPKHAVKTKPIMEISQAPCKDSCEKMKKPPCSKKRSPTPPRSLPCPRSPKLSPKLSPLSRLPQILGTPVFRKPDEFACDPPSSNSPPSICNPFPACKPCCPGPSPPPSRQRRKASPNISLCKKYTPPCSPPISPAGSKCPSPKQSHDCLSPAQSLHQKPSPEQIKLSTKQSPRKPKIDKKEKRCQQHPCNKKSNSSPKSPGGSPQGSPKSPKGSPNISLQNCSKCQKKNKPNDLPCLCKQNSTSESPPKSPTGSDRFPWPTNNQVSNPPSPCGSDISQKEKNKCDKKCSLLPKFPSPKFDEKNEKQCKPDCANMKKVQSKIPSAVQQKLQCPEKQQPKCPAKQQKPQPCPENERKPCPEKQATNAKKNLLETSRAKISGIFLKMKPSKKSTCAKDCSAWNDEESGVVRINSCEKITIRMKQETPSTEEIREGMNVKVQDEDGQTLFERKDYTCGYHRPSVLGDMYKDSHIHQVSTPVMIVTNDVTTECQRQREVTEYKSDPSIANLIEIQFKLRITQGDKTTEINIGNEDEEKQDKTIEVSNVTPEVYVAKNEKVEPLKADEDLAPKNDINIKIVVKNYKPKSNKTKENKNYDSEFSKKISDKFHTVSTGYSDVITDPNNENVYSVHRATIDLELSDEKTKTPSKVVNEMVSEELTEPITFMVSSHSTEHHATDITDDDYTEDVNTENKSISSKKDTQSYDDVNTELDTKDIDSDQDATLDTVNTSNARNDMKFDSKEEKKELLKRVFEKAHTKPKNKENVRQLRDILKIILTDSSDNDEINAASNELAKDVTYASLKPNFFRDTDSMNNYYKIESSMTIKESKEEPRTLYPTIENNSETSGVAKNIKMQGCMCSKVAERLNCELKVGCCCRPQTKMNEITSCDFRIEEELSNKTAYIDVETQNSKHLSSKSNSINLSIHSRENSIKNEVNNITEVPNKELKPKERTEKKRTSKTFSPHKNHIECEIKKLNRTSTLGITEDDKILVVNEQLDPMKAGQCKCTRKKTDKDGKVMNKINFFRAANILQCYETKKAVLEIYAEKNVSQSGEHFVAKLPKFVYEKESAITRIYEKLAKNSFKSVCRKNIITMSVNS